MEWLGSFVIQLFTIEPSPPIMYPYWETFMAIEESDIPGMNTRIEPKSLKA